MLVLGSINKYFVSVVCVAAIMASFAQLRGRIGVAGMLLKNLPMGSAVHRPQSEIQAAAVLSVLQSHGHQLKADEKARLSSMIAASAFAENDALAIVALMSLKSSNRRAAQDMRDYPYYLSKSQWDMQDADFSDIATCRF